MTDLGLQRLLAVISQAFPDLTPGEATAVAVFIVTLQTIRTLRVHQDGGAL